MNLQEALQRGARLFSGGKLKEAADTYCGILAGYPNQADALHMLGLVHFSTGNYAAAAESINRALQIVSTRVDFHFNLALSLNALGKREQAIWCLRRAAALPLTDAAVLTQLAREFNFLGQLTDSLACSTQALRISPDDPAALGLHGLSLMETGKYDLALASLDRALTLKPDDVDAHFNRSMIRIMQGDWAQGWPEFEWRFKLSTVKLGRDFPQPQWDGGDISGKTLLLHAEGGYGDTIQYVRFAPLVRARTGDVQKIILECQPSLLPLLQPMPGVDEFIPAGEKLPPFDVHIPLPSLPAAFKTELSNLPNDVPYLKIPAERLEKWSPRVPQDERLNVGLVWSGNHPGWDVWRSLTVQSFAPLAAELPRIRFFSVQKGEAAAQKPPPELELIDLTPDIHDMADTAALLSRLDLLISVETGVAHLAGALARPVWTLVPFVPSYQWLLNRDDSPWYPTMRLFRQPAPGDWKTPVERIAALLKTFTKRK